MIPMAIKTGKPEYDPAFFSKGYYGEGERGGFPSYEYHSDEQRFQLDLKYEVCGNVPHESALFIGCARGFEVAWWLAKGKSAYGLDVSRWAIANQIPEAQSFCSWYAGDSINAWDDDTIDLVASYDVLTLLPDEMLAKLVPEMVRVADKGIVVRLYVKNWRNLDNSVDGIDGATFKLRHFWEYDKLFTQSGKFKLDWMKMHGQYEVTAIFKRA